jgi:hypothetical protein
VQLFVRRKEGIERLQELFHAAERNARLFEQSAQRVCEVQSILNEIEGTKAQIRKLESEIGIFFPDEDKSRACNSLKTRVEVLLNKLDELAEKSPR